MQQQQQFQQPHHRVLAKTLQEAITAAKDENQPQVVQALRKFATGQLADRLQEDNPQFQRQQWNSSIEPGNQITV